MTFVAFLFKVFVVLCATIKLNYSVASTPIYDVEKGSSPRHPKKERQGPHHTIISMETFWIWIIVFELHQLV